MISLHRIRLLNTIPPYNITKHIITIQHRQDKFFSRMNKANNSMFFNGFHFIRVFIQRNGKSQICNKFQSTIS